MTSKLIPFPTNVTYLIFKVHVVNLGAAIICSTTEMCQNKNDNTSFLPNPDKLQSFFYVFDRASYYNLCK